MDPFETVRSAAAALHRQAVEAGADPWFPLSLVQFAADPAGLEVQWVRPGDPTLMGGRAVLDPQAGMVLCENRGSDAQRAMLASHEIGHAVVHKPQEMIVDHDVDPSRLTEGAATGVEKVVDYGQRERRELQADLFAREFLLPRERARHLHLDEDLTATDIAARTGLPFALVAQQILDALLLPPVAEPSSPQARAPVGLDPSQARAAQHRGAPFQLQAGPGTGKTRTLIARIESLIDDGVDPSTILVLTFSNKAAGELIERLAASRPEAAASIWIGTFHAFGLDILRRFHDRLGLPANPRLVDRAEAVGLVEDLVPILPLRYFRNFFDPTADLGDMLAAISRAKDEVCDPPRYRALAEALMARAETSGDADEIKRATKALDVAVLYETYEDELAKAGLVDFGDLVRRPVTLVEADPEVRAALADRHRHVLVDEYQDVNRASVRLLKAIVGAGENLWVVGDARQSIYRFRGASSASMASFAMDFPGADVAQLEVNYRSSQEVVDSFVRFSRGMKAAEGMLDLRLEADQGPSGVRHQVRRFGPPDDEGPAVAARILELRNQGVAFRDQAVLCRGNARLADLAEALEAREIPILFLGSLFERSDVRDLLSLLTLLVDPKANGLPRVAAMPRFDMTLSDVAALQAHVGTCTRPMEWLRDASAALPTGSGAAALELLVADLAGFDPAANPWRFLATWVLDRGGLVRELARSSRPRDRIRGIALWQFLAFCRSAPIARGGLPGQRLLDRVRRLALLSEERDLRQVPAAANRIDAVRLMTVHGSKGLEFEAVHLAGMTVTSFPTNNNPPRCPPPDGMIAGAEGISGLDAVKRGHEEEEQCLFFVAISRTRRHLTLYSATQMPNGNRRSPSPFLDAITADVVDPAPLHVPAPRTAPKPDIDITWGAPPLLTQDHVAQYERCPRRYMLTHVLRVAGGRTSTPFVRMHDVVNEVVRWLRGDPTRWDLAMEQVQERFDAVWTERGPTDHPKADGYRRVAHHLVEHLVSSRSGTTYAAPVSVEMMISGVRVEIVPDEVRASGDGFVFRRVRTGKERSDEMDDLSYGLLLAAARERFGAGASVEAVFLTDESTKPVALGARKASNQTEKITRLLGDLVAGHFPAKPEDRTCPRCPHFHSCGALPRGPLRRP